VLSADTLLCHIRIPRHWQQQARSLPRAASSARSRSSHTQALQARRLPSKPPAPLSALSYSSSHCSNSAGPAQSTLRTGRHALALSIHSWVTAPSAALRSQHRHSSCPYIPRRAPRKIHARQPPQGGQSRLSSAASVESSAPAAVPATHPKSSHTTAHQIIRAHAWQPAGWPAAPGAAP